ncbi:TPA: hypothetical protein DF272_00425 [Candidatus Falkowbacteria bacterium]|nr:hypothetical protein [Candidatus Falkowbacteria bacterium]
MDIIDIIFITGLVIGAVLMFFSLVYIDVRSWRWFGPIIWYATVVSYCAASIFQSSLPWLQATRPEPFAPFEKFIGSGLLLLTIIIHLWVYLDQRPLRRA